MDENRKRIAIEALEERKEELLSEIKSLDNSIKALGGAISITHPIQNNQNGTAIKNDVKDPDYNSTWSIKRKFAYLLKKHQRFLHFREAAQMINDLENKSYDLTNLASKLSSGTQSLKKDGTIVKYSVNNNNRSTFWGYKNWLDEKDEIKKGYSYNEEYVYNPSDEKEDLFSDI